MTKWKTRLFILLILVLVFGVGYSYIVAQGTIVRDQSLQKQTTTSETSIGTLQFNINHNDAVALTNSAFTLKLMPDSASGFNSDSDATLNSLDQLNGNSLPSHTKVTVHLNMLTMDCGTIQFTMTPDEQGIYHGEGIPVMSGLWMATATVTYDDQPQDEAIQLAFTFNVK